MEDVRYSVWLNKTDSLVVCHGTSLQCAKAMGITYDSFFTMQSRCRSGKCKKWTIIRDTAITETEVLFDN